MQLRMKRKTAKKVMLVIVEGLTEQTTLEGILSELFQTDQVEVFVTRGDQFAFVEEPKKKVADLIGAAIKKYRLKESDIDRVVILTDTDGCFVREDCVVHNATLSKNENFYFLDRIETWNKPGIEERNKSKKKICRSFPR